MTDTKDSSKDISKGNGQFSLKLAEYARSLKKSNGKGKKIGEAALTTKAIQDSKRSQRTIHGRIRASKKVQPTFKHLKQVVCMAKHIKEASWNEQETRYMLWPSAAVEQAIMITGLEEVMTESSIKEIKAVARMVLLAGWNESEDLGWEAASPELATDKTFLDNRCTKAARERQAAPKAAPKTASK